MSTVQFIDSELLEDGFKKINLKRIFPDNYQTLKTYDVKDIHLFCLTPITLFDYMYRYEQDVEVTVDSQEVTGKFSTLYHLLQDHFDFGDDYDMEHYNFYEEIFYFSETEIQHEKNKLQLGLTGKQTPSNFLHLLYEHISGKDGGSTQLPYHRINIEGFNTTAKNKQAKEQIGIGPNGPNGPNHSVSDTITGTETKYYLFDAGDPSKQHECFKRSIYNQSSSTTTTKSNLADFLIKPGMIFFVKVLGRYS